MNYDSRERISNYFTLFTLFIEIDLFVLILFQLGYRFSSIVYSIGVLAISILIFEVIVQFLLNPRPLEYIMSYWFQYVCLAALLYIYSRFRGIHREDPLFFIYSKLFLGVVAVLLFSNFLMHTSRIRAILSSFRAGAPQVIVVSFASIILFGSFLLYLPYSHANRQEVRYIDALFTSTSAVCVTGLVVVDTGTAYSRVGQTLILFLIQAGGLGIMTLAAFIQVALGSEMSLYGRFSTASILDQTNTKNLYALVRSIILITFTLETVGIVLLLPYFLKNTKNGWEALYYSAFHAVSAFCNAGFGLYSDNFMRAVGNSLVNFTLIMLIITGGLGFAVVMNLVRKFMYGDKERIAVQTRMVLLATLFLVIFGALFFFLFERNAALQGLLPHERFLASVFQSVTARTAGFNTVQIGALRSITLFMLCILMFIGASPGGTGGGIKTTTFVTLILSIITIMRDQRFITIFNRRIPYAVVNKALAILITSVGLVIGGTLLLGFTEPFTSIQLLFETVSAFGTVGLSTGITPRLSDFGKIVIIFCMFAGRVGPLTLVAAIGNRQRTRLVTYPEERIMVG